MKELALTIAIILLLLSGYAAAGGTWFRVVGFSDYDTVSALAIAPNGDVVAVGETVQNGSVVPLVVRLDRNGNVVWAKLYSLKGYRVTLDSVAVEEDGAIVAAGTAERGSDYDYFAMKLSPDGTPLWAFSYGTSGSDLMGSVAISDGSIYLIGRSSGVLFSVPSSLWILRLNPYGNVVWGRAYGGNETFTSTAGVAFNGGVFVAASAASDGLVTMDIGGGGSLKNPSLYTGLNLTLLFGVSSDAILGDAAGKAVLCFPSGNGTMEVMELDAGESVKGGALTPAPLGMFLALSNSSQRILLGIAGAGEMDEYPVPGTALASAVSYAQGYIALGGGISLLGEGDWDGFLTGISPDSSGELPYNGAIGGSPPKKMPVRWLSWNVSASPAKLRSVIAAPSVKKLSVGAVPEVIPGVLEVKANVPAAVYVDGVFRGTVSGELALKLSPGRHSLKVARAGYFPFEEDVKLESGVLRLVSATLQRIPELKWSVLRINSDPPGASVYINGTYMGKTPLALNVSPGVYRVELSKEGYVAYSTSVTLVNHQAKELTVRLNRIQTSTSSTPSTAGGHTTTSSTSPMTSTSSPPSTGSHTSTGTASPSSSTKKGGHGICGPGLMLFLPVLAAGTRRLQKSF
ncbi:PEGA domain-containing protein [Thermococcus sp.]